MTGQSDAAHPRLSVSTLSSKSLTFEENVDLFQRLGVPRIALGLATLRAFGYQSAVDHLAGVPLEVTGIAGVSPLDLASPRDWPSQQADLLACAAAAADLGAGTLVLTSGCPRGLTWEEAAAAFERAIEPVAKACRDLGVHLAVEHTSPLRLDVGFVQSLADALDLAETLGIGVCMEVNACWMERGLATTVKRGVGLIAVVQVSDYVVGSTCSPDRVVPGDGDIPLARILGNVLEAGYRGMFEIEVLGPKIEAEGYASAISRSVEWTGTLLAELGA
ncbi:MAG: sugar phosphate isomerase/epimerase family protein [Acidimicrobiales bacterium]